MQYYEMNSTEGFRHIVNQPQVSVLFPLKQLGFRFSLFERIKVTLKRKLFLATYSYFIPKRIDCN